MQENSNPRELIQNGSRVLEQVLTPENKKSIPSNVYEQWQRLHTSFQNFISKQEGDPRELIQNASRVFGETLTPETKKHITPSNMYDQLQSLHQSFQSFSGGRTQQAGQSGSGQSS